MRPPLRLHSYQQEALNHIARWAGISLQHAPTSNTTRFSTPRLASKLAHALQQKTP
jgi:GAF domain-containing protein